MEEQLKDGNAFLCIKDVVYKTGDPGKIGKISFTKGKLYYITQGCYLLDNKGYQKNHSWFKNNFKRSAADDKIVVKSKVGVKKTIV
jgi:hypothetical protein